MHLGCYSLSKVQADPALLYTIGRDVEHPDGVLIEICKAIGYAVPGAPAPSVPTVDMLGQLIGILAPNKTLRDNIAFARQVLGTEADALCADWLQRTHAMDAVRGSFFDPTVAAPQQVDTLVFSGGVANWLLRRLAVAQRIDPDSVGKVLLPTGTRIMGAGEHQLVRTYQKEYGPLPTETNFVDWYIIPALAAAGFKHYEQVRVPTGNGDEVLAKLFNEHSELLEPEHQTLVVGNAPNVIQAAGQFRLAARRVDKSYDYLGSQLFMRSDTFPIAPNGEPTEDAQHPISGLGQLLRNFRFLLENVAA